MARRRREFAWSDLRIFLAVARQGTLGAAARVVGLSEPTMGRRLRALEADVGETLFQRTKPGFVLTAEGVAIVSHAERMEVEAQALMRRMGTGERQLAGLLRLSSSDWFGVHVLAPAVAAFARLHPRVEVELLTDMRLYSLSRREADLVFRIKPFDEPEVVSRRLVEIEYGAYIKIGLPRPRVGDGAGTALITMNTAFEEMPDAVWLKRTLPNATVVARSNNRDVQGRLCAEGLGLAVLPRPLGDTLAGIERVDLGAAPPPRSTFVGYHRDLKRLARLRAFLDLLLERVSDCRDSSPR